MITLVVRGNPMKFSEDELARMVEENLKLYPVEGKWFKVVPKKIKWSLFVNARNDEAQEKVRKLILNTHSVMLEYDLYTDPFETLIPEKTWEAFKISEFTEFASKMGDSIADIDDQALVWAQRITNGETWEEVCNDIDNTPWFRLIEYTPGMYRLIGNSVKEGYCYSATEIGEHDYTIDDGCLGHAVPLIRRLSSS